QILSAVGGAIVPGEALPDHLAEFIQLLRRRFLRRACRHVSRAGGLLMAEQGLDVTSGVHHMHNTHARFHDAVEDQILAHREAAIATPQLVTAATGTGIVSQ
ncbi:MAG: hypothetical protein WCD04_18100, partial [Terriglobia bacterium]